MGPEIEALVAGHCDHPKEGQPDLLRLECKNIFAPD
jgi:hypothetical protein